MTWYTIRAHADVADVAITGPIAAGDGLRFVAQLPSRANAIRLAISSIGGDVTAALQVASALKAHRARVEVTIGQIAASAATLPVMAGDRVRIAADAVVMLHNPEVVPDDKAPRDARALRSAAAELDRVRDQMIACYSWRLRGNVASLLDATTWWDAAEAVRHRLADEISSPEPITACFDPRALAALGVVPQRFRARLVALADSRRAPRNRINVAEIYERRNRPGPVAASGRLSLADIYRTYNQGGAKR